MKGEWHSHDLAIWEPDSISLELVSDQGWNNDKKEIHTNRSSNDIRLLYSCCCCCRCNWRLHEDTHKNGTTSTTFVRAILLWPPHVCHTDAPLLRKHQKTLNGRMDGRKDTHIQQENVKWICSLEYDDNEKSNPFKIESSECCIPIKLTNTHYIYVDFRHRYRK